MLNDKSECHIISVNSVKGGAGKTAISLSTAINIALNDIITEVSDDNKSKVCYIDMDILGTAVESLLYTDTEMDKFIIDDNKRYINSIVDDNDIDGNLPLYIFKVKSEFEESASKSGATQGKWLYIDCILSSVQAKEKKRHMNHHSIEDSKIETKVYLEYFKSFFDILLSNYKYNYIIIDNSAGFDTLTKDILQYVSDIKFRKKKTYKTFKLTTVFVTTPDKTHIASTLSMLVEYLCEDRKKINDVVKLIVNDVAKVIFDEDGEDTQGEKTFEKAERDFRNDIIEEFNKRVDKLGKIKKGGKCSLSKDDIYCNRMVRELHLNSKFKYSDTLNNNKMNCFKNESLFDFLVKGYSNEKSRK